MTNFKEKLLLNNIGKYIELKIKNSMGAIVSRDGFLDHEKGWFYLYDIGKSGNQFNIAISRSELSDVVELFISHKD